jgi:hypothetical protein
MNSEEIVGYEIAVIVRKVGDMWTAKCPGIGGIYEEAKTKEKLFELVGESIEAIMQARMITQTMITEDNPFLRVVRRPRRNIECVIPPHIWSSKSIFCSLPSDAISTTA